MTPELLDLECIRKQANLGSPQAQRLLGERYLNGTGLQRDLRLAAKWLGRAAMRHDSRAEELLRRQLQHAAHQDGPSHLEFIRAAAIEGVVRAQRLLGERYLNGTGLQRDLRLAARWLGRAAMRHDSRAEELLRRQLQHAAHQDGPSHLEFIRVAAREGVGQAQCVLGERFLAGKDYRSAERWLRRAAKGGHSNAIYHLGRMYLFGLGMRRNRRVALEFITAAAEHECIDAQHHIVRMHIDAKDMLCNQPLALKWLERATHFGANYHDTKSIELLRESASWLVSAAKCNDMKAQHIVGKMYLCGIGIPYNRETALEWFRRAAKQGSAESARLLALNSGDGPSSSGPPGSTATADH